MKVSGAGRSECMGGLSVGEGGRFIQTLEGQRCCNWVAGGGRDDWGHATLAGTS